MNSNPIRPRGPRFVPLARMAMLALILLVGGCTNRYLITLTNSNLITSKGKPKLNQEQGIYEYTNIKGERTYVPVIRVRQIEPVPWPPPKDAATQLQEMNEIKN